MSALLSFDQAPPFAAPFRFFATAPLFAILAGILLLWSGPELFASRWTQTALALTHLLTVGFIMQVMLGAMLQILPVVAGANIASPLWVARVVHATVSGGGLLLPLAFLTSEPLVFMLAAGCLGLGALVFIVAAGRALFSVPTTSPSIRGLKLSIFGLGVTVSLGVLLAVTLAQALPLPVMLLTNVHLAWGFAGWGSVLLAAVAYIVVPMFQLTPNYPDWFGRRYSYAVLLAIVLWAIAELASWTVLSVLLGGLVLLLASVFLLVTLGIQKKSKRAKFDTTQHYWRIAMFSSLAACLLWFAARSYDPLGDWQGWPFLFGTLLIVGGFMSVIIGMLYKIVPFLVWLHLQNRGRGKTMAPNMKKVLSEWHLVRQMVAHFVSGTLLLLAVCWPEWFVYPAGIALIFANGWLLRNLMSAALVYKLHCERIDTLLAGQT